MPYMRKQKKSRKNQTHDEKMYRITHKMMKDHPFESYKNMDELSRVFFIHSKLVRKKAERKAKPSVQKRKEISVKNHNLI